MQTSPHLSLVRYSERIKLHPETSKLPSSNVSNVVLDSGRVRICFRNTYYIKLMICIMSFKEEKSGIFLRHFGTVFKFQQHIKKHHYIYFWVLGKVGYLDIGVLKYSTPMFQIRSWRQILCRAQLGDIDSEKKNWRVVIPYWREVCILWFTARILLPKIPTVRQCWIKLINIFKTGKIRNEQTGSQKQL